MYGSESALMHQACLGNGEKAARSPAGCEWAPATPHELRIV